MMMFRSLLLFILLITGLNAFADPPVVKTKKGFIRGLQEQRSLVFKGIPYAKPPVGKLRFKAPEPAENWKDTLACDHFGNVALQGADDAKGYRGSEDCLTLNVYTPVADKKAKLPVVVWVHGGAMTSGSGIGMNGHAFADRDSIVTVTINYRLGVFGFMYLGDVDKQYAKSGNNGLLDLIMALKWIKQNIKAFGGDPSMVTVMGESAGAKLTSTLLLAPQAKDLFHQLVLESGAVQCVRDSTTAKVIRQRLMDQLHITKAADLLTLPEEQLIAAQKVILKGAAGTNYFGPVQDGEVITGDPYADVRKQNFKNKRFLIGSNKSESRSFINADPRLKSPTDKALQDWYGLNDKYVKVAYEKERQMSATDSLAAGKVLTQYMYQMHSYRLAAALSESGDKVWMYRFDYSKNSDGAAHAEELAYVWYVPGEKRAGFNDSLAVNMHQAWVNFIKGRKLSWPMYHLADKTVMVYDNVSRPVSLKEVYDDKNYPSAGFLLK
ncbi:carboxylesterase family protein [Mucilaginibacter sp. RS28]|uniref:Carboxylic ester hydrolase n=1 Tax=Mucilaginibacter straminoryzae TaxID=2932774 RepID=A0A9X2B987_9SPHI|nr:carboxylesterase family protein [Mucilaginibacter straminoryzae]MCJ8210359.1 carboxylesterase family protein [Mucilaginibacter straminoryzae]